MKSQLAVNKTKIIKLARSKGYNPLFRKAEFAKAFRDEHWWLEWSDESGYYQATLFRSHPALVFGVTITIDGKERWVCWDISLEEAAQFGLLVEPQRKD